MKTKTFRLTGDDYKLTADGRAALCWDSLPIYDGDDRVTGWRDCWSETQYEIGAVGTLVSESREGSDSATYYLHHDPDGVPGNSDPRRKARTGWRGTTNGVAVYAHGKARVIRLRTLKRGGVAVTVRVLP